jgi:hypothetical protein
MSQTIGEMAFAATQHPDLRATLLSELMSQQERSMALARAHLDDSQLALDKIKHFLRTDSGA